MFQRRKFGKSISLNACPQKKTKKKKKKKKKNRRISATLKSTLNIVLYSNYTKYSRTARTPMACLP